KRAMKLWNIPGMAATVVDKDTVHYQKGFGTTRLNKGKNVNEHTLFGIASTTKAMVASGILILVDEGKLKLDDLVIKYIPELHFADDSLSQQITIRDLLAHRTGLPSTDGWTFAYNMSLDQQITKLRHIEPAASVRTRLIYQNTMYELAGLVIERVSGKRWDKFLTERLWKPIGMNETYGARGVISGRKQHVYPHRYRDNKIVDANWSLDKNNLDAAGSAWSSIHDMGLWAQFLLNEGVTAKGKRLISEKSFKEMFEPQQLIDASSFYPTAKITKPNWRTYGLGWFQQDFQGRKIDFHTGSLSGLIAIIGLDRANNKAFVTLANQDHAEARHALMWYVMDNNSDANKRDWNQEVFDLYYKSPEDKLAKEKKMNNSRIKGTKPGLPLKEYVSNYRNDASGKVSIKMKGSNFVFLYGKYEYEMSHWHLDTFKIYREEWDYTGFVSFKINSAGKITGLEALGQIFVPEK
ncbi:MAG: serine hydrolase, partial [Gammaproteobacteria bacterium]|nr:serine hydrolase [Gammaproteobacteria bacterium]